MSLWWIETVSLCVYYRDFVQTCLYMSLWWIETVHCVSTIEALFRPVCSRDSLFTIRTCMCLQVPIGLIDAAELYGSKEQIVVLCKDGGSFW